MYLQDLIKEYGFEVLKFKHKLHPLKECLSQNKEIKLKNLLKIKTLAYYLEVPLSDSFRIALKRILDKSTELLDCKEDFPTLKLCPEEVKSLWKREGIYPQGIERELIRGLEVLPRKEKEVLRQLARLSLSYLWGIAFIAPEIEELLGLEPRLPRITLESLMYALGGTFRASLTPITENIKSGYVLGMVLLDGLFSEKELFEMAKELLSNNILIFATDETFSEDQILELKNHLGRELKEFLEVFCLPPVIYLGKATYASEFLKICQGLLNTGSLGDTFSSLPVVVFPPKLFVGGFLFNGFKTFTKDPNWKDLEKILPEKYDKLESIEVLENKKIIGNIVDYIIIKRKELGIDKYKRILFDMEMRRKLGLEEKQFFLHKINYFKKFKKDKEKLINPIKIAYIDIEKCIRCLMCFKLCPFLAVNILNDRNLVYIEEDKCTGCGICIKECPTESIKTKVI